MRNFVRLFFLYLLLSGGLVVVYPAAVSAQEQYEPPERPALAINKIVVENLSNSGDRDVAFLSLIKMMVGHLVAADFAIERGDLDEARQHLTHPLAKVYPEILSRLKEQKLDDPSAARDRIIGALQHGVIEEARTEIYDAIVDIEGWQHAIDAKKMVMDGILADTAVLLMRTAVAKYAKSFKAGKSANMVEYYEGSAFVTEATTLILDADYKWKTRNPGAYEILESSLQELQSAWPSHISIDDSPIPSDTMLELVTTIEAQINDIRNSDAQSKAKAADF